MRTIRRISAAAVLGASCIFLCAASPAAQAEPTSTIAAASVADQLAAYDGALLAKTTRTDPFAGFTADLARQQIVVHLGPNANADDTTKLSAIPLPSGWTIATDSVSHSWSDLANLQSAIYTASPFANIAKSLISVSSIDEDSNSLEVGLVTLPNNIQDLADRTFGAGSLQLHQEDRPSLAGTVRTDVSGTVSPEASGQGRLTEKSGPFHGGGRFDSGDTCSEGFTMVVNGTHYGLTAGHCGSVNEQVIAYGSPYPQIGTIKKNSSFDNTWDTAYYNYDVSGTWSSAVWRGSTTSTTGQQMKDTNIPTSDTTACTDGSFNGENCHVTVDASTFGTTCVDFSGFQTTEHVCHLGKVTAQNSTAVLRGGDSGGPVYVAPSSGLEALGTIVGGTSTTGYFETIQSVLSHWGGSLATG